MRSILSSIRYLLSDFIGEGDWERSLKRLARRHEVVALRTQTSRVLAANLRSLETRPDVYERFMKAYRETLDWMYSNPAALEGYAKLAETSVRVAQRLRDEFLPKQAVDPANIAGLDELMAQAVGFKFMQTPLTHEQLNELIRLPASAKPAR